MAPDHQAFLFHIDSACVSCTLMIILYLKRGCSCGEQYLSYLVIKSLCHCSIQAITCTCVCIFLTCKSKIMLVLLDYTKV